MPKVALRPVIALLGILVLVLSACAPAAPPTPTAAPPKPAAPPAAPKPAPTAAPAKPTAAAPAPTAAPKPAPTAAPKPAATTAPAAKPAPKTLEKVTFRMSFRATGQRAPFFLAKEKGFFAEEGLDVELFEGTGAMPVGQLLAANKDTFAEVTSEAVYKLIEEGAPIKTIFIQYQKSPVSLTIAKDANIKTPKDLEGKTIAGTPGSAGTFLMPAFLKINKVDASKVTVISLDPGARNQAYFGKRADAMEGFINDFHIIASHQRPSDAFLYYDYGLPTIGQTLNTNLETIKAKPQMIRAFVRAFRKAYEYTKTNFGEAADALIKNHPTNERPIVLEQLEATYKLVENETTRRNGIGWSERGDWEKTRDVLLEAAFIKQKVDVDKVFTNEFLK